MHACTCTHTHTGISSPPFNVNQSNQTTCTCAEITWSLPLYDGAAQILYFEISFSLQTNASLDRVERTAVGNETTINICRLVSTCSTPCINSYVRVYVRTAMDSCMYVCTCLSLCHCYRFLMKCTMLQ